MCHFRIDPFLAELVDALGSELSVFGHPGSTPGERTSLVSHRVTVHSGVAEKVNATLKRERGKAEKGYAGNQPRHVVADAPNGCFSGSLREARFQADAVFE